MSKKSAFISAIACALVFPTVQAGESSLDNYLQQGGRLDKYRNVKLRKTPLQITPFMLIPRKPQVQSMPVMNGFQSYQVNVDLDGLNIPADAGNEPSIAVNPLNPLEMAIGWRQFDTVNNSFRQAGRAHSTDGGKTWIADGVFDPGVFRSDPVLAADRLGKFYYQSLRVDNLGQANESFGVQQFTSTDGGNTWGPPVEVFGGDKTWFAIDSGANLGGAIASPVPPPRIYTAWNTAGNPFGTRTFGRSLDGGLSFFAPSVLPTQPVFGTVATGTQGEVYVVGAQFANGTTSTSIKLLRSDDAFLQNSVPTFALNKTVNLGGGIKFQNPINPEGLTGQIWVATYADNVYVLASVDPPGPDPLDVMFVRSSDRGETFSKPLRINDDAIDSNAWQWFASMSVAPNGRIDIIWNDTRADPSATKSELYYSFSNDGGQNFTPNQQASPQFTQALGYPVQRKLGDYYDIVSDNAGAHIAYAATFNGEEDVYYLNAKPAVVAENPGFSALDMNNVWILPGSPSQGILTHNVINGKNDKLMEFSAIFTYKPDGTPTWLIMQGNIPDTGDSYTLTLFEPTGDLSPGGRPLTAIGLVTKIRPRNGKGNVKPGRVNYKFNTTNAVQAKLQKRLKNTNLFDQAEFKQSAFHGISRVLRLNASVPQYQGRAVFCSPYGQTLADSSEHNEGRLQYTFMQDGIVKIFSADFSYEKMVTANGDTSLVLDEKARAIPTWSILDNFSNTPAGITAEGLTHLTRFTPNGGIGFFEVSPNDPGTSPLGNEDNSLGYTTAGKAVISVSKDDGSREELNVLAENAFCGDISAPANLNKE